MQRLSHTEESLVRFFPQVPIKKRVNCKAATDAQHKMLKHLAFRDGQAGIKIKSKRSEVFEFFATDIERVSCKAATDAQHKMLKHLAFRDGQAGIKFRREGKEDRNKRRKSQNDNE